MRIVSVNPLPWYETGLLSSSSESSGPPSVRVPTPDVNRPMDVREALQDSSLMRSDEEHGGALDSAKGKEKMNITDEDFARSVFAEDALTQFEEYSRNLAWTRYAPPSEKNRVLDEFLEDQAFLNTEEIIADLAATLRPLQTEDIRRIGGVSESDDSADEESPEIGMSLPPPPAIIPMFTRSIRSMERDEQMCCACRCHITGKLIRLQCGSKYDIDCLKRMFSANVNDEYRFPPRCCGQVVPLEHVEDQLPQETLDLYKAKIEEYSTPARLYCSNTKCGLFLGARQDRAASVSCSACSTETCALCTAPSHPTTKCKVDKGVRKALKLGQSNGWQRCPRCRQLVERDNGCYHMSCRCGMQFCYLCAGDWGRCRCWKKRFFLKVLISRWLHLRGDYLVKDEPAAKNGNPVTRICKRSWKGVKKVVTPAATSAA